VRLDLLDGLPRQFHDFWGARYGKLMDPYGHEWGINQQQRQLSSEQEAAEAKRFFDKR